MSRQSIRHTPAKSNYDLAVAGLTLDDVDQSTAAVSARHVFQGTPSTPLVPPIYHSSTYIVQKMEHAVDGISDGGSVYSRLGNPTTEAVEASINAIERGAGTLTFASGMAALSSVFLGFLKSGDHVIYQLPCYPGTITMLKHMRDNFGVEITSVKDANIEKATEVMKANTKLVWIETPCNPEIVVVDVQRMSTLCKDKGILLGVDGTFGSPALQNIIKLGADFCMHSCTKYVGGHSDLIGGCVTTRTVEQWRVIKHMQGTMGNMLSPHDASLMLRGIKTLPLRMERISATALKVASFLEKHSKIQRVSYPGLTSHPQHEVAKRQMKAFSGMIMAEVKGGEHGGRTVAENVHIFRLAVSLGCVVSLLEHPHSMTHGPYLLSKEETQESGITEGMLRISIGLEDPDDLIRDLDQALAKVVLQGSPLIE